MSRKNKRKSNESKKKPELSPEEKELREAVRERFRKPNYCKYEEVREELIDLLSHNRYTAAQITEKIGIASATFFKYKALAQAELGSGLKTIEEKFILITEIKNE